MTGVDVRAATWRTAYYSESEIEIAHRVACTNCKAAIGKPCTDYSWRGTGNAWVCTPHAERRESWRQEKYRLHRLNRARIDAWRASPEYAAMLERRATRLAAVEARRIQDAHLRAIRLHNPPRARSEHYGFVPPPRTRDADEPAVPHPYYPPWPRRTRYRRPMKVGPRFVHPEFWTVTRDGGMLHALSGGIRRGHGGETL